MRATIVFPKPKKLDGFIKLERPKNFTYPEIGATKTAEKLANYDNDYNHIVLGEREEVWQKAKTALKNWQQFPLP